MEEVSEWYEWKVGLPNNFDLCQKSAWEIEKNYYLVNFLKSS